MELYDIAVVGGGPAGLTAALYAARAGRRVLLLEGTSFGGQIVNAPRVDNYPGVPACSGSELAERMVEQTLAQGVDVELERAEGLTRDGAQLRLHTTGGDFAARAVILATGVTHRGLGLAGEAELVGRGVSFCAVCDGAFFAGQTVAVVGGGNTALQDALFLSGVCARVVLIHRREEFRGEARLVDELRARENVEFRLGCVPQALEQENGRLTGVELREVSGGQTQLLRVDGLFLAVGQQPNNAAFAPLAELDESGYLVTGEDCTTAVAGLFAAGDGRRKTVRQLTTAVGDGAAAAVAACEYLNHA